MKSLSLLRSNSNSDRLIYLAGQKCPNGLSVGSFLPILNFEIISSMASSPWVDLCADLYTIRRSNGMELCHNCHPLLRGWNSLTLRRFFISFDSEIWQVSLLKIIGNVHKSTNVPMQGRILRKKADVLGYLAWFWSRGTAFQVLCECN